MTEQKKKNLLIILSIVYFIVFLIVPTILSSIDFFTKDFGWHLWYMVYIFSFSSIVFLFFVLAIFGFTKKRFFWLLGIIIMSYVISAIYIYILE